jgi:hypothetical protein
MIYDIGQLRLIIDKPVYYVAETSTQIRTRLIQKADEQHI